ncbi:dTDP-4-dehydrorhamnose 3,5-epimerase [Ochrobactrum sp. POC9]|uniref:dTDP-4-dehydrorhamnose 3,5-epimerase n=1 Tax=Ochrobactrum sp. POC9 TaxID=2203419 RepID=UPI000D7089AD|nr:MULTISPECIES: dTDP-4-dehydrorhamnose 3,5-epimerase [Brucella/Ochrobactrum group]PWU72796.1 dTDP-4-dehydrorhamnose 3,5-epimerase [Ochrobactrum sp. POC9]
MQVRPLGLDGVFEILPRKFGDDRGFFSETYKANALSDAGIDFSFVQDNHSYSAAKGVVRGLHYQLPPFAQDKLVRVTRGAILDVVVDIRKSAPTFGKWIALEISDEKWNQILVPKGFAHGFITLTEDTEVIYKVSDYYAPEYDRSIRFDDPAIGVNWPIPESGVQLSAKDEKAPLLANAEVFS